MQLAFSVNKDGRPYFCQFFYLFWNTEQSTSIILSSSVLEEWLTVF